MIVLNERYKKSIAGPKGSTKGMKANIAKEFKRSDDAMDEVIDCVNKKKKAAEKCMAQMKKVDASERYKVGEKCLKTFVNQYKKCGSNWGMDFSGLKIKSV